jgi:hypothetical protein
VRLAIMLLGTILIVAAVAGSSLAALAGNDLLVLAGGGAHLQRSRRRAGEFKP